MIPLASSGPATLACGAWLKNTVCLTRDNQAFVSPLIGDLGSADTRSRFDQTVQRLCRDYAVKPEIVAHDLHPDFYSTQFAQRFAEQHRIPAFAVQHHHAHIAAVCAEHAIDNPVLGLALDGIGLGTDGTPWGGELLRIDGLHFQRLGHLTLLALPGGDRAAQEPWRMAAAALARLNRHDEIAARFSGQTAAGTVAAMLTRNLNCPQTSSMGRLFDAAAGLLGVSTLQAHEAQAAIRLQQLAEQQGPVPALTGGYRITADNDLDFLPLLSVLIDYRDRQCEPAYAAALFHATLIEGLAAWLETAALQYKIASLAFGGGCFHNAVLKQGLIERLSAAGLQLFFPKNMPPDDSSIALGQAWVARQQLKTG